MSSDNNFLIKLKEINDNQDALQAHRDWEIKDDTWKTLVKKDAPRQKIMSAATAVREAYKYKDLLHDEIARKAEKLADSSGILVEYNKNTLGNATKLGEVQELSLEWHTIRQKGVGGSSLSEALGFHWKSMPGRPVWMDDEEMDEHWGSMAAEKAVTPDEPSLITEGVLYRGHLWESALLCYYSATTGATVGVSKATWQGHLDIQVVNVDGIILENGEPVGIAECKTSSREWTWNRGVPVHYRAQVLWYLNATGLKYADIIVRFDSGKIDIHRINAGETIDGSDQSYPVTGYFKEINREWKKLQRSIKDIKSLWNKYPERLSDERNKLEKVRAYSIEEGFLTDPENLISDSIVIDVTVLAPYVRMESSYNVISHVKTSTGVDSDVRGVSPAYYPTTPEYDPEQGLSYDDIDEMLDADWIIAKDSDTYQMLVSMYGSDGIVNASSLRRAVELRPNAHDFAHVEEVVEWLDKSSQGSR